MDKNNITIILPTLNEKENLESLIPSIVDMLENNPNKVRLFTLRSFGESFYHSITDASLEFGFKSI